MSTPLPASTQAPPRRHVLPPNATTLEKALDEVIPAWDGLAGAFAAPSEGDIPAFLPWLAAEWGIAQFDRYFDDVPALVEHGLPWLRERGTAASMLRALAWLGFGQATIDEDGAWLHLDLGRIVQDAELLAVAHVVRASLPAHVRFYRVFHGHDLRPLRLDHGPGLDAGMLDNDSGRWVDVWPYGGPVKASQGVRLASTAPVPELGAVESGQLMHITSIATYADRLLLDAWVLDSELLADQSLGITDVITTTTTAPPRYPAQVVPLAEVRTALCAWTGPKPLAGRLLTQTMTAPRIHDDTRTWTGTWDALPWRPFFETRTTELNTED